MFQRLFVPLVILTVSLAPVQMPMAFAQTAPADTSGMTQTQSDQLYVALRLPEILDVMRTEGLNYGVQIGEGLFPTGAIDPDYTAAVAQIYDIDRMRTQSQAAFAQQLQGADIAAMIAFFTTEPGQSFSALELSARTAQLDDEIDTASKDTAAMAMADNTPRYQLIKRFAEANDLIETNVVGALNANYAFYQGLRQGGAVQPGVTDDEVLASVWDQEAEIRRTTTEWVMSFLLMAYQPLSDDDLETYIAFSLTPAGADLNRAVFNAFDQMFIDISKSLGVASAGYMLGDTL